MGIQHTVYISRNKAINRIQEIYRIVENKNYRELELTTFESDDESIEEFINTGINYDITRIEYWTNGMIENVMDKPFFRYSKFENYYIKEQVINSY